MKYLVFFITILLSPEIYALGMHTWQDRQACEENVCSCADQEEEKAPAYEEKRSLGEWLRFWFIQPAEDSSTETPWYQEYFSLEYLRSLFIKSEEED